MSKNTQGPGGFSPLFRSYNELCDVISILVHCPDERMYLIAFDQMLGFHLPYISCKASTWSQQVNFFIKEYLGLSTATKLQSLWRVVRIWRSNTDGFLTNAVFEVPLTSELKKKLSISRNPKGVDRASWLSEEEILQAYDTSNLASPELLTLVPIKSKLISRLDTYHGNALIEGSNLIEVPRDSIISSINSNIFDILLESLELKNEQVAMLYSEFLRLTFPNVIMGVRALERFATHSGWNESLWKVGVRGADMTDKGGLFFREFLYLICVVDPECNPTGLAAEARARFIFRCFDLSRHNQLSPKEFLDLMRCIRSFQPTHMLNSMEKDIEQGYRVLDLRKGSDVPLHHFLQATSLQKLKGVDTMLKSKRSVTATYPPHTGTKMQDKKGKDDQTKLLNAVAKPEGEIILDGACERVDVEYKLSNHLARVSQGRLNESKSIDKLEGVWCTPKPKKITRHPSDDLYNPAIPSNQILYLLKFFTSQYTHNDATRTSALGKGEPSMKKRFDWDTYAEFEKFVKYVITVCDQVTPIFDSEPRLLSIESPVYVFGDIHGNIQDITCYDRYIWPLGVSLFGGKILFLGDYVDRGHFGIEVVGFLFAHKVRSPNQVYLVRGNHEVRTIQKNFTFYNECIKRCGTDLGNQLWEAINKAFDYMPLAAVIDKKLFCCHGGIPPPWSCPTVQYIQSVPHNLPQPEKNAIAWNLMWNDPVRENQITESLQVELLANNGFAKNKKRGTAYVFDTLALEKFLNVNNLSYVIRAHEAQEQGYQIHHKGKIITVFSSSFYNGGSNTAACLLVKVGSLKLMQINTNEYHF